MPLNQDVSVSAVQSKSQRIRAFDIMRGIFLAIILINHIELYPSFFDFFTGRGRLFVSAAEGFFFMSGLLVGMVYKRRLGLGMRFIFKKMWRRAGELYVGSVILSLLFTFLASHFNHPDIKDSIGDTTHWRHIIGQTLLMRYGYGWADFLDRFAILMLMAPFFFYLIAKGRWRLMLLVSIGLWLFRGQNFTLSWQLIYMVGMLAGFHWDKLRARSASLSRPMRKRLILALFSFTAITFIYSYASVYGLSKLNQWLLGDPKQLSPWWQAFTLHWNNFNQWIWQYAQKWTMGPLRVVLFMAWFLSMYLIIRRYETQFNRWTQGLIELLGRNSLFVYIDHAFIVFAFRWYLPRSINIFENFAITAAALLLLFITTIYYQKWRVYRASGGSGWAFFASEHWWLPEVKY